MANRTRHCNQYAKHDDLKLSVSLKPLTSVLLSTIASLTISAPLAAQNVLQKDTQSNVQNGAQLLAAYEGNPEAQFQLALSYSKASPNYALAAYWYKQAARQGMANAQYNLGHFYLQGLGVTQDTTKTIQWWEQAAHQNYTPAQHNIGTAYFEGIGVTQSDQVAEQWFLRCAESGSKACKESLKIVRSNPETSGSTALSSQVTTNQTETQKQAAQFPVHIQDNKNSAVIANLSSKDDFTILQTKGNWHQIKLNRPLAIWSYKSFVSINNGIGKFTGDKVRARTKPSTKNSKVVAEIDINTSLPVLEETDKWVKLALAEQIAWTPLISENTTQESSKLASANKATLEKTSQTTTAIVAPKKLVSQYTFSDRRSDDEWLFVDSKPEQYTILLGNYDNSRDLNTSTKQFLKQEQARLLLAKRGKIEWKYLLYGNFANSQLATSTLKDKGFKNAFIARISDIQEQRCSAWKTTIPSPKKLGEYCLKKTASTS